MPKIRVVFEKVVATPMRDEIVVEADSIGLALVTASRQVEDSWNYVFHEVIPADEAQRKQEN